MTTIKQWILTILAATAYLVVLSQVANAGWLYDVEGIMAPTLANPVSASFTGEIEFPTDLATEGELRISLTNEFDEDTGDPIVRTSVFAMSANIGAPVGTRLFQGTWNEQPFAMQWMDFDAEAQNDFSSITLENGGEWDAWGIGFPDYQLGSITQVYNGRETPQVNEPAALALLAVGGMFSLGILRGKAA
jgi:hypothetical protein